MNGDTPPEAIEAAAKRGYTWRTARGREFRLVTDTHWRCQECDAKLDDEDAVMLHDAWHSLPERRRFADRSDSHG